MFSDIVDAMAYGALAFSVVEIYLMLNKLWSRKHIKDVAESISVSSRIVGLIPLSIFTLHYANNHQWQGVIEMTMWLFAGIVQLLIGVGVWVKGNRRMRILTLLRRSLRSERGEVRFLAQSMFHAASRDKVIDILTGIALIDGKLHDNEKVYIDNLAKEWHTNIIWGALRARHKKAVISPYFNIWEDLDIYLSQRPSREEIEALRNMVNELIAVDGQIHPSELIIMNEFDMLIERHNDRYSGPKYQVAIVPQSIEQNHYLSTHFSSLMEQSMEGGTAYVASDFYSKQYAEEVKSQFQKGGYFTTIMV